MLLLLSFLTEDVFVAITDTFAFVRLWRTVCANLRGHLTDALFIGTTDQKVVLIRCFDFDTCRNRVTDFMAEAELQHNILTLNLGPVTDAGDLQFTGEPFGNPRNQTIDQAPCGTPHLTGALVLRQRGHGYGTVGLFDS